MSALDKLACRLGIHSEAPNQELARELAQSGDKDAIAEITAGLESRDKDIQSDCIKVLYEVGYLKPELIARYSADFLNLLQSRNNRLVWGAMIALSTIAPLAADAIREKTGLLYDAMKAGSVITIDNGVKVLAALAAQDPSGGKGIMDYLLEHLRTCRAKEVPQHAESTLPAINSGNRDAFIAVLKGRETNLIPSQLLRIKRIYKSLDIVKQ